MRLLTKGDHIFSGKKFRHIVMGISGRRMPLLFSGIRRATDSASMRRLVSREIRDAEVLRNHCKEFARRGVDHRSATCHRRPFDVTEASPPEGKNPWPASVRGTTLDRFNRDKEPVVPTFVEPVVVEVTRRHCLVRQLLPASASETLGQT